MTKRSSQALKQHVERERDKSKRQSGQTWTKKRADHFIKTLPKSAPTQRLEALRRCLRTGQSSYTRRALRMLFEHVEYKELRALLKEIKRPSHAFIMPVLAAKLIEAEPFERYAIIGAISRMGHPAGEPLLLELLDDPNTLLMRAALGALKEVGTPASLKVLRALEADPREELSTLALEAREAVEERYPGRQEAGAGALTVVDELSGALSETRLDGGALELYKSSSAALAKREERPRALLKLRAGSWSKLKLKGRPVSWVVRLWGRSFGGFWQRELFIGAAGLAVVGALGGWASVGVLALIAAVWSFMVGRGRWAKWQPILTDGVPTLGELVHKRSPENAAGAEHLYVFQYMDEKGRLFTAKRSFARAQSPLEDEPYEGMLFLPGEDASNNALMEDELPLLRASGNGQWSFDKRWLLALFGAWGGLVLGLAVIVVRFIVGF